MSLSLCLPSISNVVCEEFAIDESKQQRQKIIITVTSISRDTINITDVQAEKRWKINAN